VSIVRAVPLLLFASLVVAACGPSNDNGFLQSQDVSLPSGTTFDPNNLLSDAAFVDLLPADLAMIQGFLERTAYDQPSFLATYDSNGVSAALAIVRASQTYRINPIVFLAHAERAQGLIGARTYPLPATRVEFVFGCGCTAPDTCDAALGGFDKQLDCLGRALRTSMDQLTGSAMATDGGWAVGTATKTIDGQSVTPGSNGTAALYQYLPLVGDSKSGNKLFFTILQLYEQALMYFDPGGG
jgi:hypothetical protein